MVYVNEEYYYGFSIPVIAQVDQSRSCLVSLFSSGFHFYKLLKDCFTVSSWYADQQELKQMCGPLFHD